MRMCGIIVKISLPECELLHTPAEIRADHRKEFAAAIRPTEFALGRVFGSGAMAPIDYCVALAEGRVLPPANLDIAARSNETPGFPA
jgi:hypothetical protein